MQSSWITRVPTESNISDEPSRLQFEHLLDVGCVRDNFDYIQIWKTHVRQSGVMEEGEASDQPACPLSTKQLAAVRGSSVCNLEPFVFWRVSEHCKPMQTHKIAHPAKTSRLRKNFSCPKIDAQRRNQHIFGISFAQGITSVKSNTTQFCCFFCMSFWVD